MTMTTPNLDHNDPARVSFVELGLTGDGIAFAGPDFALPESSVNRLCDVAEECRNDGSFSRESPPRVRALHHLCPEVINESEVARLVDMLSFLPTVFALNRFAVVRPPDIGLGSADAPPHAAASVT